MTTAIDIAWDVSQLSFEQTIPRSLVHKRSLENVLLTEIRSCGPDRFICAGRIPSAHRFFNDAGRTPRKDILFYTELGRQASLAVSHTFLAVPRDEVFIFEGSEASISEAAWQSVPEPGEDSVLTEIRIHEIARRKNEAVSRVVAEHIMSAGSERVFRGTGAWTLQPPALFQRLRRMSKTHGAAVTGEMSPFQAAGRMERLRRLRRDNIVISAPTFNGDRTEFTTSLVIDAMHPYFFDHPCDHVPGMLLLEGCVQLSQAALAKSMLVFPGKLVVTAYNVNFHQFVECGLPVTLTAHLDTAQRNDVRISISQQNVLAGTAALSVSFGG